MCENRVSPIPKRISSFSRRSSLFKMAMWDPRSTVYQMFRHCPEPWAFWFCRTGFMQANSKAVRLLFSSTVDLSGVDLWNPVLQTEMASYHWYRKKQPCLLVPTTHWPSFAPQQRKVPAGVHDCSGSALAVSCHQMSPAPGKIETHQIGSWEQIPTVSDTYPIRIPEGKSHPQVIAGVQAHVAAAWVAKRTESVSGLGLLPVQIPPTLGSHGFPRRSLSSSSSKSSSSRCMELGSSRSCGNEILNQRSSSGYTIC